MFVLKALSMLSILYCHFHAALMNERRWRDFNANVIEMNGWLEATEDDLSVITEATAIPAVNFLL